MNISVLDLFSIGIGPSSSHTVGPMKAAYQFIHQICDIKNITRLQVIIHGSLAHTGKGHMTHHAILMGLEGHQPECIDPKIIQPRTTEIITTNTLHCPSQQTIKFNFNQDFIFDKKKRLPYHTNAIQFFAYSAQQDVLAHEIFYSIGGGFIENHKDIENKTLNTLSKAHPFSFQSAEELLNLCHKYQMTISQVMLENEKQYRKESDTFTALDHIAKVMLESIDIGCQSKTVIPGSLQLPRRAPALLESIMQHGNPKKGHPHPMNCLNCFAMAASEQNASGGRIVTAPTNGAAGIIPALIKYHQCFDPRATQASVRHFLLTAGAVCLLYKFNASISGAEMGCQGEIGVACSIAAAGLTAARGGTLYQIENAAEIGIEHNLGLTCDPVGGLVQIPCIERNAMGAVKAVNASSLALASHARGKVTLDMAIKTMRDIGEDMKSIYKETSLGGLAVNVPAC